jgi:DNA polymerase III alpha subunit (gram-positive type)
MKHFITIDIETGGIGDDKSILQVYMGFCEKQNDQFFLVDEVNVLIKPNDDVYKITAESLTITNIDLVAHNKVAVTEKRAGTIIYDALRRWYDISKDKLIPIGHNVAFDIRRISNTLISQGSWDQYVSYRVIDTCTIAQFLRLRGNLPNDLSCSLVKLVEYFNIEVDGLPHEAKYDALSTVKVLENLLKNQLTFSKSSV